MESAATFMNALLICIFGNDVSQVLRNRMLSVTTGTSTDIVNLATIDEVVELKFSVPAAFSRIALQGMNMSDDAWS